MKSSPFPRAVADAGIGEAARQCGTTAHVLRHWESVGLLAPRRDAAGRRRYDRDDLAMVAAILLAKQARLPLDRLRDYLAADREVRYGMLAEHLADLRSRIGTLQSAARASADALVALGADEPDACRRYGDDAVRTVLDELA